MAQRNPSHTRMTLLMLNICPIFKYEISKCRFLTPILNQKNRTKGFCSIADQTYDLFLGHPVLLQKYTRSEFVHPVSPPRLLNSKLKYSSSPLLNLIMRPIMSSYLVLSIAARPDQKQNPQGVQKCSLYYL